MCRRMGSLCCATSQGCASISGSNLRLSLAHHTRPYLLHIFALSSSRRHRDCPWQGVGYTADERARLMVSAGAIEAIVAGLRAHTSSAEVQERGVCAFSNIASSGDEVLVRRMAEAGVAEIVENGLAAHMNHVELWACGQATLGILHAFEDNRARAAALAVDRPLQESLKISPRRRRFGAFT